MYHIHVFEDETKDYKIIGVFTSYDKALDVKGKYIQLAYPVEQLKKLTYGKGKKTIIGNSRLSLKDVSVIIDPNTPVYAFYRVVF